MDMPLAPKGARWNEPNWHPDPEEWEALSRRIAELEAENSRLTSEIGRAAAHRVRLHSLEVQSYLDQERARDADRLEKQRDMALGTATSLHAIVQHLAEASRSGFLARLATILAGRVAIAGASAAFSVSWRGRRQGLGRFTARRIAIIAGEIAHRHRQDGQHGFIAIGVTAPDNAEGSADSARAHVVAALIAVGVPLSQIGSVRYHRSTPGITVALHDVKPSGWKPLVDAASGRFAHSATATPLARLIPALAPVAVPPSRRLDASMGKALRSKGGRFVIKPGNHLYETFRL